jgi:O-antigen/teichoic acid export membrane protein
VCLPQSDAERPLLIARLPPALQSRVLALQQRAPQHGFVRNVAVMLTGTIAGQAISLAFAPVLTRIFTPSQFGVLGVYTATLMILGMIASLALELAIPICLGEAECANLVALCGIVLAGMTAALGVAATLIPPGALDAIALGPLVSQRYLLPLGLLWLGGYHVMLGVATRASAFKDIAHTRLAQGLGGPMSQLTLGLLRCGATGLVIGYIIGQTAATLPLLWRFVVRQPAWFRSVSRRGMAAVGRRYIKFPLFASWSRLLDMAGSGDILFVLFSACYSPSIAGFMFLSERVIVRPLLVVSTSLLQVFTGEAGRAVAHDPAQLRRRFWQVVPLQLLIATVWIAAANIVAGWAFPLVFGSAWSAALPYLRALSLSYLAQIVLHPVSGTLQVLERQALAAVWQVARLLLVVAAVLLPWHAGLSAVEALWITTAAQVLCCLVLFAIMARAIGNLAA